MVDLPRINLPQKGESTNIFSIDLKMEALDSINKSLENINKSVERMSIGVNVKLASIAMMLSDFFEGVERNKLIDNRDQVKPPPKPSEPQENPKGWKLPEIDRSALGGMISAILTGLGIAFLSSRMNIDKAIQESGIFAYLAKGVAKGVMVATGLSKIVSSISNNGVIASMGTMVSKIFGTFNSIAKAIVPFYAQAIHLGKGVGKLIPFIAIATSIVDFMRGFARGEGALNGIKEGLAEVAAGWIGWPLNILKNIIGWVAGKFGFENIQTMLEGVDFVEPVKNLVRITFDTIKDVFTIDTDRLADFSYWKQKIFDLLYLPVNVGVNFLKSIFDIGDPESTFKMSEFIAQIVQKANALVSQIYDFDYATAFSELFATTMAFFSEKIALVWETIKVKVSEGWDVAAETIKTSLFSVIDGITKIFTDVFDKIKSYIPSADSISQKLVDHLPDFMIPESIKKPEQKLRELDTIITEQKGLIERSKNGDNVFWGAEDRGRGIAQSKIDEANRIKNEMMKNDRGAANINAPTSVIIGGSTTNNASSVSVTNMSPLPSNGRPD